MELGKLWVAAAVAPVSRIGHALLVSRQSHQTKATIRSRLVARIPNPTQIRTPLRPLSRLRRIP